MKKTYLFLGLIVLAAFVLRVVNISTNPPALSWDEASIGYNAFSILTTGKDEHGKFLPIDAFAAFGDYKPPIPVYLTVPFVAVFGLTELAVRLPSALAGTLTVFVLYFLVIEFFRALNSKLQASRSKRLKFRNFDIVWDLSEVIALLSALLLAITPWHIMLSRAGFEGNIAFLFVVFGIWLVLRARHVPVLWLYCWLPFVAGVYTFNSARYAGPMIAFGALVFVRQHIVKYRKNALIGLIITFVALLPIVPHLMSKEARLRFDEVNIFTNLETVLVSNERREADNYVWWSNILHNRRVSFVLSYMVHFLDNLEPRFLFIRGDGNPKFSIQDTGQLLAVSAPFFAYGAIRLYSDLPSMFWFLVWVLAASIAPAAVARETPHALRVENSLPWYTILTAYGIVTSVISVKRRFFRYLLIIFSCVLFTANFLYFWHTLIRHYPIEYSGTWQYGYKQVIEFIQPIQYKYDTIVLTESIGRPYIYTLFYEKTHPDEFWRQKNASFDDAGFYNVYGYGKYRFVRENVGSYSGRTLFILPPSYVPDGASVLKEIRLLNGNTELVIFES